ncbi:hypothetical protein D9M69_689250 [compost metagenome]
MARSISQNLFEQLDGRRQKIDLPLTGQHLGGLVLAEHLCATDRQFSALEINVFRRQGYQLRSGQAQPAVQYQHAGNNALVGGSIQ